MILRNATIKYKGYDPSTLTKGSHKRVCVSCNICGRVRWIEFRQYRNLCNDCSKIGINKGKSNCNYKSKITLICQQCGKKYEVIPALKNSKFCSNICYGKWKSENHIGENSPAWKGGSPLRDHVLSKFISIKLNTYFKGSNFHHIMSGVGIYIPKDLHQSISHNLKNGKGMKEINKLAMNYLVGEFCGFN